MAEFLSYNEKELFRLIAGGDQDAFAIIFRTYSNPLYWNAFKLLNSEFWAEEIVQSVFTQLWMNRANLTVVELPSAYLYRMVTNKARDRMRKHQREVKMQYWMERQTEEQSEEKHLSKDWNKLHDLLEEAVETLPPQRQQVYKLKYHEHRSYEEIAELMSLSKNTVRNHMTKALEDIRAYLLKHADFISWLVWLYFI